MNTITRMSECLISLERTRELRLCVAISRVLHSHEIALHKNNEWVLQTRLIKHERVLVFIPYYNDKITQLGLEEKINNRKGSYQHHWAL